MCVTEGQFDIVVPSGTPGWTGSTTTFKASEYGKWSRGAITSEASFDLSANEMSLTCVPQPTTVYPGTTAGILSCAYQGLFDAATVSVFTAYMPVGSYGDVSNGIETKFFGYIEKITKINRTMVQFSVQDPLFLLNEQIPKRLIQSSCPWSFGDSNCKANAASYTQAFTLKSGSTQSLLTPTTAFTQPNGYFSQGIVTCTSGNNAGLSATVKVHASGNLELTTAWILPVAAGDTFSVVAGCDKTTSTCAAKFNNLINYGGCIAVPVPIEGV